MKLLVFGRTGQVARELARRCPAGVELRQLGVVLEVHQHRFIGHFGRVRGGGHAPGQERGGGDGRPA